MKKLLLFLPFVLTLLKVSASDCNAIISYSHYESKSIDSVINGLKPLVTEEKATLDLAAWSCNKRLIASAYARKGFYKLTISQLEEVLDKLSSKEDNLVIGLVNIEMGNAFKMAGEYAKAIDLLLKGSMILESKKKWKLLFNSYVNIAEYYRATDQHDLAKEELKKAFSIYDEYKINDPYIYIKAIGRKASLLNTKGTKNESIEYSKEVIDYGIKNNDPDIEAMAHNEIGVCYCDLGFPDSAYYHYDQAIKLWDSQGPSSESAHAKYNKIMCFSRNSSDSDSAIILCRELQTYIESNNLNYPIHSVYYRLFKEFEKAGVYDSAIHYQRQRYKAFAVSEVKKLDSRIYEIQESYQNEKIIAEKQKVQSELEISNGEIIQADLRTQMLTIFAALVLIILLILAIFFRKQRKSNSQLQLQNVEKDILLKEINHRVKNNMQMVSSLLDLQSEKVNDTKSKQTLKEAGERIKALAFAHQELYLDGDFNKIRVKEYLELISRNLLVNSDCKIKLLFNAELVMNIEKAQALGFIVNELITNALKYAWDENSQDQLITIQITEKTDHRLFEFKDNGIGIPENFNEKTFNSLGLMLVKSFVNRQLKGELKYSNNDGCQVKITINE